MSAVQDKTRALDFVLHKIDQKIERGIELTVTPEEMLLIREALSAALETACREEWKEKHG